MQVRFLSPAQACNPGKRYSVLLVTSVVWAVANGLLPDFRGLGSMKGHFGKRGDKWYFWAELGTDGDASASRFRAAGFAHGVRPKRPAQRCVTSCARAPSSR